MTSVGIIAPGTPAPVTAGTGTFDRSAIRWGSLYVTKDGKLVTMNIANMSDAQIKAALGMAANKNALADGWNRLSNGQIVKGAAPTATSTPTPTATPTPAPTIDPRDGTYQAVMAQNVYNRDYGTDGSNGLIGLNARLETLPGLYNRGAADIQTGYNRNRYDSNAELASRGIIRSGEYQHRGADRLMAQTRQTADLEKQYGSGARSEIAATVAAINQQYGISSQNALQAAKDRYPQAYPASTYIAGL